MRFTRANIKNYFELLQIDGIPEGFSFKEPNINIGGIEHQGNFVAYVPLTDIILKALTVEKLLELWKKTKKLL